MVRLFSSSRLRSLHSSAVDSHVLAIFRSLPLQSRPTLNDLLHQYDINAHTVLDNTLANEPMPPTGRHIDFAYDDSGVIMLAHVVDGREHDISFSSGFAVQGERDILGNLLVSCAHTLEEMRHHRLLRELSSQSTALVFHQPDRGSPLTANPIVKILASRPRSDVILFGASMPTLRTLPLSPYPAPLGTRVRAHFVSETRPAEPDWRPWIHGTWSKWVRGRVVGYRDFAGNEAEPGTYNSLSHLLFDPPPSPGSSGGPIVAEDTRSVIGMILGSMMNNRLEGLCGWGIPSEAIYEMFKLPGLECSP